MIRLLQRESTIAVLLGAQSWKIPGIDASEAFKKSADHIKDYLLSPAHLNLPEHRLLDLFDDKRSGPGQVVAVGTWIEQQIENAKRSDEKILDLLLYYVGHGSFLDRTQDHAYYLLVRETQKDYESQTGILVSGLASCLNNRARHLRRFIVLDCCFAGKAGRIFQSCRLDAAIEQAKEVMPRRGTVLLCSSSGERPSFIAKDGTLTMFSGALHRVLVQGNPDAGMFLTFQDICDMTWDIMREADEDAAVRPVCYAPDQSEGDLSKLPAFPNPAHRELEERRRREEAEAARLAAERREAEARRLKEQQDAGRLAEETKRRREAESTALRQAAQQKDAQTRGKEDTSSGAPTLIILAAIIVPLFVISALIARWRLPASPLIPPNDPGKVVQVHANSPFHVGDLPDVRIKVLRPSYLFCFLQHQTGEATLLYPASRTQESRFGGSKAEMKFPDDFGLKTYIKPYKDSLVENFHCIVTEQPLRDELEKKWFENTIMVRGAARFLLADKRSLSLASSEADEILSELRKSAGYAEDSDTIKVMPKENAQKHESAPGR